MSSNTDIYCIRLRFEGMNDGDNLIFMDLNTWEREYPEIVKSVREADYKVTIGDAVDSSITEEIEWVEELFYQSDANVDLPCKVEDIVTFVVPYESF